MKRDINFLKVLDFLNKTDTSKPKILRKDVLAPEESAMSYFLKGDDGAYQYLFRMRRKYFFKLLSPFSEQWSNISVATLNPLKRKGRRRQLNAELALALVIRYLLTTTEVRRLICKLTWMMSAGVT